LIYKDCKVYGPYKTEEGRNIVILVFPNGRKKTTQYARYLMEKLIGRYLQEDEEVHHKDGDFTNDGFDNLEIKKSSLHKSEHSTRYTGEYAVCIWCGKDFWLYPKKQSQRARDTKRGKAGPFCSKSCVGQYGAEKQVSASRETLKVESPKFGEALSIGNPEPSLSNKEGVETKQETPKAISYGEEIVQTTKQKW
jgi:hypothetical protein